jgi:anaerobic magnesium-protoporphyrin IX monomethyl ester cyclase
MLLSAILKRSGHKTEILIADSSTQSGHSETIANADLIGFYCVTGEVNWLRKFIKPYSKRPPLVLGGPHPTFIPAVISDVPADFAIRGEAEEALPELIESLGSAPEKIKEIKNLCFINMGELHISEQRDLVADLDLLPFQDVDLYMKHSFLQQYIQEFYPVVTSRGCPNSCSFCFNKKFRELHNGKGAYTRRRSPEGVIEELQKVKHDYQVRKFVFEDDSLIVSKPWFREFSELYRREISNPFICQTPAASLDKETVKLLTDMNCISVKLGVETADEGNRSKILNKKVTNAQIAEAAALLKTNGIMIQTFNMAGIPGEGIEHAMKTMYFNREIKADFTWVSFYHNYPGTDLYVEPASGNVLPSDDERESYFSPDSNITKNIRLVRLGMLMQFFNVTRLPSILVKIIISLPLTPFFKLVHKLFYALSIKKINRLGWLSFIRISFGAKKYF